MFGKKKYLLSGYVLIILLFSMNNMYSLEPVEIGSKTKKDVTINYSIIESIKDIKEKKLSISKDIRTKSKKNMIEEKNIQEFIKNEKKLQTKEINKDLNKKLNSYAYIDQKIKNSINKIQIFFNDNSANVQENEKNKIIKFLNEHEDKNKLHLRIMSYARKNKKNNNDISRRTSLDRAINIRTIIIDNGVPPQNLIVKALGNINEENTQNIANIEIIKKM